MQHVLNCTGHEIKLPDIVRSDGAYVFDSGGKRYVDLESGVWCISIGHNNSSVRDAAFRQWDALLHAGFAYSNPIVESAASRLLDVVGMRDGQCVFLCSGSEAIEISRQISRHVTRFETSLTFADSYLGAYSSVSDRRVGWHIIDWLNTPLDEDRLIESIPNGVSDFVLEPGSSSGHVRFPPRSLVERIVKTVRSNGGKIIANEVTTGVGRTGEWFGYQHYGITPDLIAIGKGVGNGYPVSVAVINSDTADELRDTGFHYSQSHQNDPVGACVVREVVNVIENGALVADAARKGADLLMRLRWAIDDRTVLNVRGRGLMIAIDLCDSETTDRVYGNLIQRGFIVGNRGTFLRVDPPLTVPEDELKNFSRAFNEVVRDVSHTT